MSQNKATARPERMAAITTINSISSNLESAITTTYVLQTNKLLNTINSSMKFLASVANDAKVNKFTSMVAQVTPLFVTLSRQASVLKDGAALLIFQQQNLYPMFATLTNLLDEAEQIPK